MSEVETRVRATAALPSGASAPQQASGPARVMLGAGNEDGSFGRALAAAREARGLSQADVAAQLRLHRRQIKAIEEEDLASLPEGPFVRGYVRNFARLVDLPAEPLLSLLNAALKPTDPLRGKGDGTATVSPIQRAPRESLSGRMVIGGAVAALIVFAVFGWWTISPDERKQAAVPVEVTPSGGVAAASPPPAAPAETTAIPPAAGVSAPVAAVEPAAPPTATELRLRFRDRSWVEIRQADGAVLMSQINAAGTTQTVGGEPPYTLVIGNASKVDLEYRGRPVELASSTNRDDVARLRLE